MKKLLFALTPAQNIANGSSIYTGLIFRKAIELQKSFDAYYHPGLKENRSLLENVPETIRLLECTNNQQVEELFNRNHYDAVFFGNESGADIKVPEDITPFVVIHDLRFLEVPNDPTRYFYRDSAYGRLKQRVVSTLYPDYDAVRQKKRIENFFRNPKLEIITVSHHTKYSLLLNFPQVKENRIHVLTSHNPMINTSGKFSGNFSLLKDLPVAAKEYFLIISAGRWFKNAFRAIQALDDLAGKKRLGGKKVLVIGARRGSKITKVRNPEAFVFKDFLESDTLQCAYANAYCFVYPSLQEGFGTPPLEAMQYGTPVLAASNSAINEVCAYGPGYFNPYSVMEIENRILHLLSDRTFYEELSHRGIARSREIATMQQKDLDALMHMVFD